MPQFVKEVSVAVTVPCHRWLDGVGDHAMLEYSTLSSEALMSCVGLTLSFHVSRMYTNYPEKVPAIVLNSALKVQPYQVAWRVTRRRIGVDSWSFRARRSWRRLTPAASRTRSFAQSSCDSCACSSRSPRRIQQQQPQHRTSVAMTTHQSAPTTQSSTRMIAVLPFRLSKTICHLSYITTSVQPETVDKHAGPQLWRQTDINFEQFKGLLKTFLFVCWDRCALRLTVKLRLLSLLTHLLTFLLTVLRYIKENGTNCMITSTFVLFSVSSWHGVVLSCLY